MVGSLINENGTRQNALQGLRIDRPLPPEAVGLSVGSLGSLPGPASAPWQASCLTHLPTSGSEHPCGLSLALLLW